MRTNHYSVHWFHTSISSSHTLTNTTGNKVLVATQAWTQSSWYLITTNVKANAISLSSLPQPNTTHWVAQTAEIYFHTVQEARSLRSRCPKTSLLGLPMTIFSLWARMASPLCIHILSFPLHVHLLSFYQSVNCIELGLPSYPAFNSIAC